MKRTIAVALVLGLVGMAGCDSGAKKTETKADVKAPDGKVAEPAKAEPTKTDPPKVDPKPEVVEAPPAT